MSKVLITGFTGFIGQRLSNAINGQIRVLSRNRQKGYDTVVCDLQSDIIPKDALTGVKVVYHLAGFAHDLSDAIKIQNIYKKVNVDATIRLAKLAVKSNVKRFIFVSSIKAGGNSTFGICASEKDQGDPEGIYGKTKREAELKLLKIGKESGMHVSIIRPSLVYGPNVKGNLQLMLSGIKNGWFPPLPETGNRRSMIHVDDLVRAILLVAEDKRANGEIFIATDGTPHSSREIYDAMCNIVGRSIPKWNLPKALFNIASLISPRIKYKINNLFKNFELKITDIQYVNMNGGSVICEIKHSGNLVSANDNISLAFEQFIGLNEPIGWERFSQDVQRQKSLLIEMLTNLKAEGKRVVAYGAAAKFMTMLNYCGVDSDLIEAVGDANPRKQKLLCPGVRIPVVSPRELMDMKPDYVLIGAWNFKKEIIEFLKNEFKYDKSFIVPLPIPEIIK